MGRTYRTALAGLLALLALGLAACDRGGAECGDELELCGDLCVDVTLDPANCGGCGQPCAAGFVCSGGACTCPEGEEACEEPDGVVRCTNLATDLANCGACRTPCDAGSFCIDGSCGCPEGETSCEGGCVDLDTDVAHCGACGEPCGAGATCVGGSCGCAGDAESCDGSCVDTATDPANCGGCGVTCPVGATCEAGSDACVDPTTDAENCGACGNACPAATPFCAADGAGGAHCVAECALTQCGTDCVDTQSSNEHCGGCDQPCTVAGTGCAGGTCGCLEGELCGEACVNTQTSNDHCGGCGNACPAGTACAGGGCACVTGELCGEACVDTATDEANCGGCGITCAADQTCEAGGCICTVGTACGEACVDVEADEANCGGCGVACGAGEQCLGGTCARGDLYAACFQAGTVVPFLKASDTQTAPATAGLGGPQALALLGDDHVLLAGGLDVTLHVIARSTMAVVATEDLGTDSCPNFVAVRGTRAYVVKSCVNTVQVVELADPLNPTTVDEVSTGAGTFPQAGAFDASGTLWVSLLATNQVVGIDFAGAAGVAGTPVALPDPEGVNANPSGVAVVGGSVWVAQSNLDASYAPAGPARRARIDAATGAADAALVDLGSCQNAGFAATDGALVYVPCAGDFSGNGEVAVLDPATSTVVRRVATGGAPGRVSVDGSRAGFFYASDSLSASLLAVDAQDAVAAVAACAAAAFEFVADVLVVP